MNREETKHAGMSLRDWFAGMALQGLCSQTDERTYKPSDKQSLDEWRKQNFAQDAKWCYAQADAMLTERNKETK